jgi:hypothetical protein
MATVNKALNFVFDVLLLDFLGLGPFWQLAVISILFAVGALLVFKKLSNQKGIRAAKDKVTAHLLQVILFQDDVRTVLRAQGKILRYNFVYLGHNMVPMVFLVLPFILVVMNLDPRFRFDPARAGEPTYVTVTMREGVDLEGLEFALDAPAGIRVETPPVRATALRTVDWRLRPERDGIYSLTVRAGDDVQTKRLVVGERVKMLAPKREGGGFLYQLANPGEPPIPKSSPIEEIRLSYPRTQTIPVLGIDMHWLVVFLIVSLGFGFAIKGALGVEI